MIVAGLVLTSILGAISILGIRNNYITARLAIEINGLFTANI
jgi:hypothetical protein